MNRIAVTLLLATLVIACERDIDDSFTSTQRDVEVNITLSPTTLDESSSGVIDDSFAWSEGDRLGVNNSSTPNAILLISEGLASGKIGESASAEYLYFISPYSATGSFASNTYSLYLPTEQSLAASIATSAYAYGRSTNKWSAEESIDVEMHHLMAHFEIDLTALALPETTVFKSLTLRSLSEQFVARTYIIFSQNAASALRYELGEERTSTIALDLADDQTTTPRIALFPQSFKAGESIYVEVVSEDDGGTETKRTYKGSFTADLSLAAGNIYPTPSLTASEDLESGLNLFEQIDYSLSADLATVETLYISGDREAALTKLLSYYRNRINYGSPDFDMPTKVSDIYTNRANQALDYRFYINSTYIETVGATESEDVFYQFKSAGDSAIDWLTNPFAPDHETQFESQLHRWAWMLAQSDAYYVTKDEQYAENFIEVYNSWRLAHPMPEVIGGDDSTPQNIKYAWNELAVANRISKYAQLLYSYINSASFTSSLLEEYLVELIKMVEYMRDDYRSSTNILVSQVNAILSAGVFFPEIKKGDTARQALRGRDWLEEGATKIVEELTSQLFEDGFHNEATLGYHTGVVSQFFSALEMGERYNIAGLADGGTFNELLRLSTLVLMNITYPDYSIPCFNDSFDSEELPDESANDTTLYGYYEQFPDNDEMLWMATKGRSGTMPTHKKYYMRNSGYYVLRSGWGSDATMMIHTNNPRCYSHNQADNGTFELWHNGRNFFPDSGAYTYNDGDDRTWFRSARNHNTLTLNEEAIADDNRQGVYIGERSFANAELIVTENQSYSNLLHRRSILHVYNSLFVIVDEAMGSAEGVLNLNFNVGGWKGDVTYDDAAGAESTSNTETNYNHLVYDEGNMGLYTTFTDESNIVVRTFTDSDKSLSMSKWDGRASYAVNHAYRRKSYSVDMEKSASESCLRYLTVILPTSDNAATKSISAEFTSTIESGDNTLTVSVDGVKYDLCYSFE